MKMINATLDQKYMQTDYEPEWLTWLGCLVTGLVIFLALVVF